MIVSRPALKVVGELMAWSARQRYRFRVAGPSMEPTLADGDFVLVDLAQAPGVGELALASPPGDHQLRVVKRVARITADGGFWLSSDNPERGVDSRRWGTVAGGDVHGRVTLNLTRPFAGLSTMSRSRSAVRWLRR